MVVLLRQGQTQLLWFVVYLKKPLLGTLTVGSAVEEVREICIVLILALELYVNLVFSTFQYLLGQGQNLLTSLSLRPSSP